MIRSAVKIYSEFGTALFFINKNKITKVRLNLIAFFYTKEIEK